MPTPAEGAPAFDKVRDQTGSHAIRIIARFARAGKLGIEVSTARKPKHAR
jgi:hypothetical protein